MVRSEIKMIIKVGIGKLKEVDHAVETKEEADPEVRKDGRREVDPEVSRKGRREEGQEVEAETGEESVAGVAAMRGQQ